MKTRFIAFFVVAIAAMTGPNLHLSEGGVAVSLSYVKASPFFALSRTDAYHSRRRIVYYPQHYHSMAELSEIQPSGYQMREHEKEAFRHYDSRPKRVVPLTTYATSPLIIAHDQLKHREYLDARKPYYENWTAPDYIYRGFSSYGIWDGLFLWKMLDHTGNLDLVKTYYHHQDDAGIKAWRKDADEIAEDHPELQRKLDALDKAIAGIRSQKDPAYVPDNAPKAAYMAKSVATDPNTSKMVIGTGGPGSATYKACEFMKAEAKKHEFPIDCKTTDGSPENLYLLMSGQAHAGFVQADALRELMENPEFDASSMRKYNLYDEVVYLLVNRESGIDDITDVDAESSVYTLGHDAKITLERFEEQDSDYAGLAQRATILNESVESLSTIANNPGASAFFLCAPRCDLMEIANKKFGHQLKLVPIDDWSLNNARDRYFGKVYEFTELGPLYPNLQDEGFFSDGSLETLAVSRVLMINNDWLAAYTNINGKGYKHFRSAYFKALNKMKPLIAQ